jgi:DNA-directed RNA polymerase sigma subunit (sigma70/sigma32)
MNESDFGLKRYLQEIGRFPLLTPEQEVELAQKIRKGNAAARERMINANLRLVVTIARDYANFGLPLLDLISDLLGEVDGLLEVLDPREKKIICQRFGLDGGEPKTLEDVGKDFGITRERIRQLQNVALAKLRRALTKKEKVLETEFLAAA